MMSRSIAPPPGPQRRMAVSQSPPSAHSLCQCLPASSLVAWPALAIEMKGLRVSSLLQVLMLIDTVAEADMLARELRRAGFEPSVRRAVTEAAYRLELASPPDLILADSALAEFDAMRALQILRTGEQDIPLIVLAEAATEAAAI